MPSDHRVSFLYVEDDAHSREVVDFLLKRVMGYTQVAIFDNSESFVEKLKALPFVPEVILLDIHLRPLNGYQLLKLLREDPAHQASKIIAITASVMKGDLAHLQEIGFDALIAKPVPHKLFPDLIQRILAGEQVWYVA